MRMPSKSDHTATFFRQWIPQLIKGMKSQHFLLGSLNARWVQDMPTGQDWQPVVLAPYRKYWLRSEGRTSDSCAQPLDPSFTLRQLEEKDISRVIETSGIARRVEYIRSRLPYSVAFRHISSAETGQDELAGWGIIHEDGSVGTLWVEELFRRKGLGRKIVEALVDLQRNLAGVDRSETFWASTETSDGNPAATSLFMGMDGWHAGWICHWVSLSAGLDTQEVLDTAARALSSK